MVAIILDLELSIPMTRKSGAYQRLGFVPAGLAQELRGIRSMPRELKIGDGAEGTGV